VHGAVYITTVSEAFESASLATFLKEAAALLQADLAYIHLFSGQELQSSYAHETIMPFRQGITTHALREHLPDLCWGTVFGSPYVRLFGLDRLLSSPAPVVARLQHGAVYVQLSGSLFDLSSNHGSVDKARVAVKEHLDRDAFFDPQAEPRKKYRVPEFSWI
jgi:hypothetical protein